MNINFTPEAAADLGVIRDYISQHDIATADRTFVRILQAVAVLENFPLLGRIGRVNETREFSIADLPYYAVCRLADEIQIDIIAIMHGRRKYL